MTDPNPEEGAETPAEDDDALGPFMAIMAWHEGDTASTLDLRKTHLIL